MTHADKYPHRRESAQEFPRSPRVEPTYCRIQVMLGDEVVADTTRAKRVIERGHPPVYYIPSADIRPGVLWDVPRTTQCGDKGLARFYDVIAGQKHARCAAWAYPEPQPGFEDIKDHVAFYPGKMDGCYVDDERAKPEPSDQFGGWITSNIIGPFYGGRDQGGP